MVGLPLKMKLNQLFKKNRYKENPIILSLPQIKGLSEELNTTVREIINAIDKYNRKNAPKTFAGMERVGRIIMNH